MPSARPPAQGWRVALQAAHRRLRRPSAQDPVRSRAVAAGHRVSVRSPSRSGARRTCPAHLPAAQICAERERGAVTAELAMAVPLLLALTIGLVWLLTLGTAQVRMVDATREAARALARGDSAEDALARARVVAPTGAVLSVSQAGDQPGDRVVVSGSVEVDGVGGLFDAL